MNLPLISVVAAGLCGVALSAAAESGPVSAPRAIDREAAFAGGFPAVADEHHVADWALYAALVDGDIVSYAGRVDSALGTRLDEARGKAYQTQQLEAGIKQDKRLRAAFDEHRRRIRTMVLYTDDGDGAHGLCQRRLEYIGTEFRLILGARRRGAEALASATVAPSCAPPVASGLQITAGQSPRYKCWSGVEDATCGWRLPDMPDSLKQVIESHYPATIKLRWRWRGLGAVNRVRVLDAYGNRGSDAAAIAVTTPVDLGLEFVDANGHILWTATAATLRNP